MTSVPPGIFKAYDVRGLYGEEMDGDTAWLVGRAFARVLARLRAKEPGELRVGLGRDMRVEAPEMARRVRDGLVAEGCAVLDAGMIATEMLYELVGSRELDGGAMVTASHNPKAYTGIKLVREGALALSGDAGIGDVRATIEAGLPEPPGGGIGRGGGRLRRLSPPRARVHRARPRQAAARGGRRRQRDGGADGRPPARAPRPRSGDHLLGPRRGVPRPRAEPPAGREPALHRRQGARGGREPGDRLGRRRRSLLLHRRPRRVRGRRLLDRAPRPAGAAQGAGRGDPLRRSRQPRRPRHRARGWAAPRT